MHTPCCPNCNYQLTINESKYPSPQDVLESIGKVLGITCEDILTKTSKRTYVRLRQVYCYLSSKHSVLHDEAMIGKLIDRDATSVSYAVGMVQNALTLNDKKMKALVSNVEHEMSKVFTLCS